MSPGRIALLVQLATTLPLVGLVWTVQVVAYPQFLRVGRAEFVAYHAAHARLITFVVGPLMLAELAAAFAGAFLPTTDMPRPAAWLGLALVVGTWLVTIFVSVPLHDLLDRGFDERVIRRLVATNWLRTVAWSSRGALLLWTMGRHA